MSRGVLNWVRHLYVNPTAGRDIGQVVVLEKPSQAESVTDIRIVQNAQTLVPDNSVGHKRFVVGNSQSG
jgi:hypothetical protein